MSACLLSEAWVVAVLAAAVAAVLLGGPALARRCPTGVARGFAWSTLVFGTSGVERLLEREPPCVRMLALIAFALLALKVIVVIEERARGMASLTFGAWLGFAAAWPGMRPRLFTREERGVPAGADARALLLRGVTHAFFGALAIALARLAWMQTHSRLLATAFLLPGLSLLVHFGLCNLLAGAWRLRGVACEALFRAPLRSQNLAEFWSRRWNLAFSEMTALAVYRPLAQRFGRGPALMAGFTLSGLLHEMALSVPVRAGFGLPLLYFLIHGALVLVERALADAGRPLSGWAGRAWTIACVVAPLPMLFHRPFLAGVVWPLIGIGSDG